MWFYIIPFVFLNFFGKFSFAAVVLSPTLELAQGKLQGIVEISTDGKLFYSYMKIPYAKPPVKDLRFEKPVKHTKWTGVLQAKEMPPMCLQVGMFNVVLGNIRVTGSEDCLYLNVFTPAPLKPGSSKSVMVYVHGGGFMSGAALQQPPYVLLNEDIVLVVIQYRLGVFGFLSTGDSSIPGNMGLFDQRMALQWVKENIRSFGGNPNQVTIFGESAGAASCHLHMLSPGSKGLFNRAILQSGSALAPWSVSDQHRKYAIKFGGDLGCPLIPNSNAYKQCLKQKNGTLLLLENVSLYKWAVFPLEAPRVDRDFLPDFPTNLIKRKRTEPFSLMVGTTKDEGAFFITLLYLSQPGIKILDEDFSTYAPISLLLQEELNPANLSRQIYAFYLKNKTRPISSNPVDNFVKMLGDSFININSDMTSIIYAHDKNVNLYMYQLDHKGQRSLLDPAPIGLSKSDVAHTDDLWYLFSGGPFFGPKLDFAVDIQLRRTITKLWTNFAKFGDPTPKSNDTNVSLNFQWNPATTKSFQHLSLLPQSKMKNYNRREQLYFWLKLKTKLNMQLTSG